MSKKGEADNSAKKSAAAKSASSKTKETEKSVEKPAVAKAASSKGNKTKTFIPTSVLDVNLKRGRAISQGSPEKPPKKKARRPRSNSEPPKSQAIEALDDADKQKAEAEKKQAAINAKRTATRLRNKKNLARAKKLASLNKGRAKDGLELLILEDIPLDMSDDDTPIKESDDSDEESESSESESGEIPTRVPQPDDDIYLIGEEDRPVAGSPRTPGKSRSISKEPKLMWDDRPTTMAGSNTI